MDVRVGYQYILHNIPQPHPDVAATDSHTHANGPHTYLTDTLAYPTRLPAGMAFSVPPPRHIVHLLSCYYVTTYGNYNTTL